MKKSSKYSAQCILSAAFILCSSFNLFADDSSTENQRTPLIYVDIPKDSSPKMEPKEQVPIESLVLNQISLVDAAKIISLHWGRPIVVSEKAKNSTIDIFLNNTTCEEAVKAICRAYNLWYNDDSESIIYIQTVLEFKEGVKTYGDEKVEVIQLLYPSATDIGLTLEQIFRDKVIWSLPDSEIGDDLERIERALERMDLLAERGQFALLSAESGYGSNGYNNYGNNYGSSYGGGYNNSQYGSYGRNNYGSNSYRNSSSSRYSSRYSGNSNTGGTPINREEIDKVTSSAENASIQHALQTGQFNTQSVLDNAGLVHVAAMPSSNNLILRSADKSALEMVKNVVQKLDVPHPQVLLEVKVLELDITKETRRGIDWLVGDNSGNNQWTIGFDNGIPNVAGDGGGQEILGPSNTLVPQGTGMDTKAAVFSAITKNLRMRIQMLDGEGEIRSLATPTLLVADSEASRLFIGSETTILTEVKIESRTAVNENSATVLEDVVTPTTQRRNVGTSLVLTPKISADRSVQIRILHETSSEGKQKTIRYATDQSFDTTDIDQRSVTSTVVAQSGQVIAVGGMISETLQDTVEHFPGLSDIPYIGNLFDRVAKIKNRFELVVLIRPYVILAPGETETFSRTFFERMSQHPSAVEDIPPLGVYMLKSGDESPRSNTSEIRTKCPTLETILDIE